METPVSGHANAQLDAFGARFLQVAFTQDVGSLHLSRQLKKDLSRTDKLCAQCVYIYIYAYICAYTPAAPAPSNYPLRDPKYHLIETIRPSIEVHWRV